MEENESTCQECGRRRATVHLTDYVDGQAVLRHLCERCYSQKEGGFAPPAAWLFAQILAAVAPELNEMSTRQCPVCGINYLEFRQTLSLGCPNDYRVFDSALEQLIEHIHGSARHCGKVAAQVGDETVLYVRIRSLEKRQQKAVAEENYELAAELRERIKELEKNEPDGSER